MFQSGSPKIAISIKACKIRIAKSVANVLFEREKSMVPDTMKWVEAECKARKNQEEINKLNSILKEYSKKMKEINQEYMYELN